MVRRNQTGSKRDKFNLSEKERATIKKAKKKLNERREQLIKTLKEKELFKEVEKSIEFIEGLLKYSVENPEEVKPLLKKSVLLFLEFEAKVLGQRIDFNEQQKILKDVDVIINEMSKTSDKKIRRNKISKFAITLLEKIKSLPKYETIEEWLERRRLESYIPDALPRTLDELVMPPYKEEKGK